MYQNHAEGITDQTMREIAAAASPNKTARTERNGFVYVSDCEYATDPATIADVKVGDRVRIESTRGPWYGRPYEGPVLNVGRDEFGIYLNNGEHGYGNTIIHSITIIERA